MHCQLVKNKQVCQSKPKTFLFCEWLINPYFKGMHFTNIRNIDKSKTLQVFLISHGRKSDYSLKIQ